MSQELVSYAERPDLRRRADVNRLHGVWPDFMHHDAVCNAHFGRVRDGHAALQTIVLEDGEAIAEANVVPVAWDGRPEPRGIDWALDTGSLSGEPTTLCALQVMIRADRHGRGLSQILLRRMVELARAADLDGLIAPVRPTLKPRYPLIPIERYMHWCRDDGQLFDPWLRVHERIGGELLDPAPESMRIEGEAPEWTQWAGGLEFPEDGDYIVPGALVPVRFESGRGVYVEPNVWMRHS